MAWQPVEYRESCGLVRGGWTVRGAATALPPARPASYRFRAAWPAGESPHSQPARLGWFRDRLFWGFERMTH